MAPTTTTSPSFAALRRDLAARQDDLRTCHEMLQLDPSATDALETIPILEADIADIEARIAAKQAAEDALARAAAPSPPPPPAPKYDMSKHPKFAADPSSSSSSAAGPPPPPPPPGDAAPTVFRVKDHVLARYSRDRQWYPATVIAQTGSSHDPLYSVTFKGYGNTETKRAHEIRAAAATDSDHPSTAAGGSSSTAGSASIASSTAADLPLAKKRKISALSPQPDIPPPPSDRLAAAATTTTTTTTAAAAAANSTTATPVVISAAPSVDTSLVSRREPSRVSDGPTRLAPEPKKLKGKGALEKSKNSWNAWQQTGPKGKKSAAAGGADGGGDGGGGDGAGGAMKKVVTRESQFRTPEGPNAKVGFTNSGRPMQKEPVRTKWLYEGSDKDSDKDKKKKLMMMK